MPAKVGVFCNLLLLVPGTVYFWVSWAHACSFLLGWCDIVGPIDNGLVARDCLTGRFEGGRKNSDEDGAGVGHVPGTAVLSRLPPFPPANPAKCCVFAAIGLTSALPRQNVPLTHPMHRFEIPWGL